MLNQFHELNSARKQNHLHFERTDIPIVFGAYAIEEGQCGLSAERKTVTMSGQTVVVHTVHIPEIRFVRFRHQRPMEFRTEYCRRINHQQIVEHQLHGFRVRFDEHVLVRER